MSSESPTDAVVDAKRARRREWLLRGAFEAVLILIGLLGAFALDEWQDARSRAARVESLMGAVRAELEANLRIQEDAAAYNTKVAAAIWDQATRGAEFIPETVYSERGLFVRPRLTSAAWDTSQNDPAIGEVAVEKLLVLAKIYDEQRLYVQDLSTLRSSLYAALLQTAPTELTRKDGLGNPLQIGGILQDFAGRGERLVELYEASLAEL